MKLFDLFKTHKAEKITALAFLLITIIMVIGLFFTGHDVKNDFLTNYRNSVLPGTPVIARINGAIDSLEKTLNDDTYGRNYYIEFYGWVQKSIGKRVMEDAGYGAVYKTKYDQICYAVPEQDVSKALEGMTQLKAELDEMNIPLLYIQAPFKLRPNEQQLPDNVKDYSNANADQFLKGLEEAGINSLDLRKDYWSKGMSQNELFFNTDHHWTINGAFSGYTDIVKALNSDYGFHIDEKYTELNNFDQKVFKNYYIGSMGRRVGAVYGGMDDFTLITPNFDTDYTVYDRDYGGEKIYKGTFQQAVLSNNYIAKGTPPDTNRYAVYHGDNAEIEFVNHNVNRGKLLVVKDSFGLPIYSFLSLGIHEVRALDVRLYKDSVAEYAKKYHPEVVVVIYNADCFGGDMFNFNAK